MSVFLNSAGNLSCLVLTFLLLYYFPLDMFFTTFSGEV